jgi:hypothetical protein
VPIAFQFVSIRRSQENIVTTRIPELSHASQGFWFMVSDARTDFAMTMSLLFLISVGGGSFASRIWRRTLW